MNLIRVLKLGLLMLLAACGGEGGVDSGGTGGITPAVVSGPIAGFGSVIVGGVRFDDVSAEVEDLDGARRGRDELRLGMTVEIESGAITEGSSRASAVARRIRFESEITGLVAAVDLAGDSFTVLGQRVMVDATTVFDERFANGLASLSLAQPVEVYAVFDAALQRYRATRVEPASPGLGLLRLRGPVAEVNPLLRTLRIGTASYRFDRASDVPLGLAAGTWVRLRLQFDPSPVSLWEVQRFSVALRDWADADEVRIEGLVTLRGSGSGFVLNGRVVDGSGLVLPPELVVGARAEVRGVLRGGVLRATRVTVRSESEHQGREFEVEGTIDVVDAAAGTLRLRGLTIGTRRPGLRFDGGSAADLVAGRRVEVRAVLGADRRTLEATRIGFR
jgi:hypothetical protein